MADVQHKDVQSADCHEPKHITNARTLDTGKVITPSSVVGGVSVLRKLTLTDIDSGELTDLELTLVDDTDGTKKLRFQLAGITTATTRTLTVPDASDVLVVLALAQTLTNKTIALGSNTISGTLAQFNTAVTDANLASLAGAETLTNKTLTAPTINGATIGTSRINPRVVALTDAATIASNSDTTDMGTVTLAGNRTLGAPTGTPVDGQIIRYRVRQDATAGRTLAYNAIFRFTAATAPTVTATANATSYLTFIYHAADVKWDCISVNLNFQA